MPSWERTRKPAGRCWSCPGPSTWCAPAATSRRWTTSGPSRWCRAPGFPCAWVMSPRSRSGRRCGAVLPNSTAMARWPVAWWFCARARMPRKPSKPSRPSSASYKAACPRAWRSSPPTTAAHSLSGRSRTSPPNSWRSSSWWLWSASCSSGTYARHWSPSFLCRWGSWRRFW